MATQLRIDRATPEDVPLILDLIRGLAEYERLAGEVVATEAGLRESLFGERPAVEAVIARIGSEAVGFAIWFQNYSTFLGRAGLYLEDLFVLPRWRGRGVGRALLAHLARVAVERGYGRMEWSVLDWNESAIRFYRALGAEPLEGWTVYRLTGAALERAARV
ncbi:MAG: GNAT family N-acetyltransferase [Acidobacteria bacterium]|nr:GNAT family N-acetyltransferase [Acidobacteriota bacterium]